MRAEKVEAEVANMVCASCGVAEVDDIKLMDCDDCDLVRYCSDACQKDHRSKHEAMCKERTAELRDEILFRQPESSHLGDCPICFLPIPIIQSLDQDTKIQHHFGFMPCCSKMICKGCTYANVEREKEACLRHSCPFCRHIVPDTDEEANKITMKRVAANDPAALHNIGRMLSQTDNFAAAVAFSTKAAALGDVDAHYKLGFTYLWGVGGIEKDEERGLHHLEEAAIGGHPDARYDLGCYEGRNDRSDRAVKHLIIAANLGHDDSIQMLKKCYTVGHVSKEDFAAALRGHQAAVDATKSPLREASKNFDDLTGMVRFV